MPIITYMPIGFYTRSSHRHLSYMPIGLYRRSSHRHLYADWQQTG